MKRRIQTEQRLDQPGLGQRVVLKSAGFISSYNRRDTSEMTHLFSERYKMTTVFFSGILSVRKRKQNSQSGLTDGSQSPVSPGLAESKQNCLKMIEGGTTKSDWDAA